MPIFFASCDNCGYEATLIQGEFKDEVCPKCQSPLDRNPRPSAHITESVDNGAMGKAVIWRKDIQTLVTEKRLDNNRERLKNTAGNAAQ